MNYPPGDVMGPSGASHMQGLAPDPGGSAGTTKFLREDATWVAPQTSAGARAYNSGNISISNNTATALTFDSERYDTDAFHSTSSNTGRITIPSGLAGKYILTANVEWAGNATGYRTCAIRLNGSTVICETTQQGSSTSNQRLTVTTIYDLAAADYVEVVVFQTSGGNLNVVANARVSPEFSAGLLTIGSTAPTNPTDIYIATTGSDSSGDGSSGSPYLTLAKAISGLPDALTQACTIHVSDGTYTEGIDISRLRGTRTALLSIVGNTTTPTNVKFTGTVSATDLFNNTSVTVTAQVRGNVHVMLQGITLQGDGTAATGLYVQDYAYCIFDRCTVQTSASSYANLGVQADLYGYVEFRGNCTIKNWTLYGIGAFHHASLSYTSAGTLTITGPGSAGDGVHLAYHGQFICSTASCNITITAVLRGFQLGLGAMFQHTGGSSTISITNVSTPGSSSGIQATDQSSWSTNQTVTLDHFTLGYEANSISYIEATGTRNHTNLGTTSSATQNAQVYLP